MAQRLYFITDTYKLEMSPKDIEIWHNIRETVSNSSLLKPSRRDITKADADLALAIMQERRHFKSVSVSQIYAHKEKPKKLFL